MKNAYVTMMAMIATMFTAVVGNADQIGIRGDETVVCSVTKIEGSPDSFIPPQVGSRIRWNLATERIQSFDFEDGTTIGLGDIRSLLRTPPSDQWRKHQMFFIGQNKTSQIQLIVGAYGDLNQPLNQRVWGARIQQIRSVPQTEWSVNEIDFECIPVAR